MRSRPLDTTRDAAQRQVRLWRDMAPTERAALADQLSIDVTRIARAGIEARRPGAGPNEVLHELARRRYGATLADAAFASDDS
jgi:hypothetical protein